MRLAILLVVVLVGCGGGMTGALDRGTSDVAWEYCRTHACDKPPVIERIGDGCYIVNDSDFSYYEHYECALDADRRLRCRNDDRVAGWTYLDREVGSASAVATQRCGQHPLPETAGRAFARWTYDLIEARREICWPPAVMVVDGRLEDESAYVPITQLGLIDVPKTIENVPDVSMLEVMRSGKDKLLFSAELCVDAEHRLVLNDTLKSTGFARIDQTLRKEWLPALHVKPDAAPACAKLALVISHFDECPGYWH